MHAVQRHSQATTASVRQLHFDIYVSLFLFSTSLRAPLSVTYHHPFGVTMAVYLEQQATLNCKAAYFCCCN